MSNTDQMTNLGNRRAYEEMMTEYQTKPMEADLAIYTVDLNGVKQVNDSLGHSAGDQVIRGAA